MTGWAAMVTGVLLGVALAGCGGDQGISSDVAKDLERRVERISTSVDKRSYGEAQEQLDELVEKVSRARADGDVTAEQATRIGVAAEAVDQDLRAARDAASSASRPTSSPRPHDDGEDREKGKGGKGEGGKGGKGEDD